MSSPMMKRMLGLRPPVAGTAAGVAAFWACACASDVSVAAATRADVPSRRLRRSILLFLSSLMRHSPFVTIELPPASKVCSRFIVLHLASPLADSAQRSRLQSGCLAAGHRILDEADNRGDDCAGNAAADRLPDESTDIDIAGRRSLQHRQQCGEERPTPRSAERAGNRVAQRAEIEVLHRGSGGVAAESTGNELDDEIDEAG